MPGAVHCYRKVCHRVKTLAETQRLVGRTLTVTASYYDDPKADRYNVGLLTSSGERFDARNAARAASSVFPDGTELLVWNPSNGRAAHVRVNDFGPFHSDRTLDITRGLAERLQLVRKGVADLRVTVIAAPPAGEPRYRAFRTYPEAKGYLGRYSETEIVAVASQLVGETLSRNPPLPEKVQRFAGTSRPPVPQPKPWHRPARGTEPAMQIALQSGTPADEVTLTIERPLALGLAPLPAPQLAGVVAADAIATRELADRMRFVDLALRPPHAGRDVDRLRFAAAILSAPTPAVATLSNDEEEPSASTGPATVLSYVLASAMLAMIGLLIAVVTRPMRVPPTPAIVATDLVPAVTPKDDARTDAVATAMPERRHGVSVIGADLYIDGDVTGSGDIILEGCLDGDCRCSRLTVAKSGRLAGDIVAEELIVEGVIGGNILARTVEAKDAARIAGEVSYNELAIAADAHVEAVCRMRPRGAEEIVIPVMDEAA